MSGIRTLLASLLSGLGHGRDGQPQSIDEAMAGMGMGSSPFGQMPSDHPSIDPAELQDLFADGDPSPFRFATRGPDGRLHAMDPAMAQSLLGTMGLDPSEVMGMDPLAAMGSRQSSAADPITEMMQRIVADQMGPRFGESFRTYSEALRRGASREEALEASKAALIGHSRRREQRKPHVDYHVNVNPEKEDLTKLHVQIRYPDGLPKPRVNIDPSIEAKVTFIEDAVDIEFAPGMKVIHAVSAETRCKTVVNVIKTKDEDVVRVEILLPCRAVWHYCGDKSKMTATIDKRNLEILAEALGYVHKRDIGEAAIDIGYIPGEDIETYARRRLGMISRTEAMELYGPKPEQPASAPADTPAQEPVVDDSIPDTDVLMEGESPKAEAPKAEPVAEDAVDAIMSGNAETPVEASTDAQAEVPVDTSGAEAPAAVAEGASALTDRQLVGSA